jgi:chromosome transmission fidelity protein 1
VPYATLLHKSTREACGLNLRNSVVIIDEAHNLLETISSIHNVSICGAQISLAHFQLTQVRKTQCGNGILRAYFT